MSSSSAVARHARAFASLRKEVTRDGNVRWVRITPSGDGERGNEDRPAVAVRRDATRSRPFHRTRRSTNGDSSPETNRQRALNARVSTAPDAVSALRAFAEAHRSFPSGVNELNVAALFVALARTRRLIRVAGSPDAETTETTETMDAEREIGDARAALGALLARLRELAPGATGRVCANVLHALGQLEAQNWWVLESPRALARGGDRRAFETAAASVVRRAGETANRMNAQELANALNGVSRLGAFAAASMPNAGWASFSDAFVERAREDEDASSEGKKQFAALAAVLALNALAGDKTRAAAAATSQAAFDVLIGVAARAKRAGDRDARVVDTLSEQGLANVLNACAKLEKARIAVERLVPGDAVRGWSAFTSRIAALAPSAGDQGLSVALHALTLCGDDARESVDADGWRALAERAERLAPTASPQAAAMLLNAAWKLAAEPSARGFGLSAAALEALGRRAAELLVEETARKNSRKKVSHDAPQKSAARMAFDEQATFVCADALGKLPAARAGFAAVAACARESFVTNYLEESKSSDDASPATHQTKPSRATRDPRDAWRLLAERLARRVAEAAPDAEVAEDIIAGGGPAATFHVLARLPELANALRAKTAWRALGGALARLAPFLHAEDCARILNGYAKQRKNALVVEATPPSLFRALARRVARLAASDDIEAMHVATLADALKKLPVARGEFERLARGAANAAADSLDSNPWDDLARVIAASAADLEPLQVTNVVSALGWLEPLAAALARREGGWRAVLAAAERRAASIERGANESAAAAAPDFSAAPEARKWLEKTSAGLELVRGHAGYARYGDEGDRERLVALEAAFRDALRRLARE